MEKRTGRADAFTEALAGERGWGLTRADIGVIGATVLLAVGLCCVLWFGFGVQGVPGWGAADPSSQESPALDGASAPVAVVQNSEGFYEVLPLNEDAQLTVESSRGTNVVEVANGSVRCVESDCGNQVCVGTGWVNASGQMIVCLPHQLTVQVVDDPSDAVPLV